MKAIPCKIRHYATALAAVAAMGMSAQSGKAAIYTWVGTGNNYRNASYFTPNGNFGAGDLVVFNESSYVWAGPGQSGAATHNVGAMISTGNTGATQTIQPLNTAGATVLVFAGYDYEINGENVRLLIGTFGTDNFSFTKRTGSLDFKLALSTNGVVYANADTTVRVGNMIIEQGGSYSITKRGEGVLWIGDSYAGDNNTFSGGLILEEGILKTQYSSSAEGGVLIQSPFGTGTLTLRGGAIETTTTNSRTYHNSVALDGSVRFGTDPATSSAGWGNMTISDAGGGETRLLSNSTLEVNNHVSWGQNIKGNYSLTKEGTGYLVFSANGTNYEYTGNTYVNKGGVVVNGNLVNSQVVVNNGGTLSGLGSIYQNVTVNAGGVLSPGFYSVHATGENKTAGTLTLYGNLTMEAGSTLRFHIGSTAAASDSIYTQGSVVFDNVTLDIRLTGVIAEGAKYVLIQNDGFDPITGSLLYNGNPLADGSIFHVVTDAYSQTFQLFYNYTDVDIINSLVIVAVPEASSATMIGGGFLALLGYLGVRRKHL